jgi:cobalamin biosynthesis protein CbiM
MQALLFADGGLTALGLNVFNMSVIGVWVGYAIFILVKKILPKNKSSIGIAAFLAGLISVPAAAAGFVLQYAVGGTATFSISQVLTAMLGTHFLIGIGEGVISALAVGAVMASRSDLVYGYKGSSRVLETRTQA